MFGDHMLKYHLAFLCGCVLLGAELAHKNPSCDLASFLRAFNVSVPRVVV